MPNKTTYGLFLLFRQTQVLPHPLLGRVAISTLKLGHKIKLGTLAIEVGLSQHWIHCQQWTQQEKTVWNACNWVHKSTSSCPHAEHLLLRLKTQGIEYLYYGSTTTKQLTKSRILGGKWKGILGKLCRIIATNTITKSFVPPCVKAMKGKTEKKPMKSRKGY